MTVYTWKTYKKALVSGGSAFVGAIVLAATKGDPSVAVDLAALGSGDWIGALFAGLGAGGLTFLTPNAEVPGTVEKATTQATEGLSQIEAQIEAAKTKAIDAAKEFQDAVGIGGAPGSLVEQALRAAK